MTAAVYRMFDESDALLYIGMTTDLEQRMSFHFDDRNVSATRLPGASEIRERFSRMTCEWFDDEWDARWAERDAITAEAPELNRQHNPSRWTRSGKSWIPAT